MPLYSLEYEKGRAERRSASQETCWEEEKNGKHRASRVIWGCRRRPRKEEELKITGKRTLSLLLALVMLLCSFPIVYAEDAATEVIVAEQEYNSETGREPVMVVSEPAAESEPEEVPEEPKRTRKKKTEG